ncbi:hypothetical protein B0H17DRAFT_965553, partial [Mycena rosella]
FIGGPDQYGWSSMMWNIALDGNGKPMVNHQLRTPYRCIVQINANEIYSFNREFRLIAHAGKAITRRDVVGSFAQRITVTVGSTFP